MTSNATHGQDMTDYSFTLDEDGAVTIPAGTYISGDITRMLPWDKVETWNAACDRTLEATGLTDRRFRFAEVDGLPVIGICTADGTAVQGVIHASLADTDLPDSATFSMTNSKPVRCVYNADEDNLQIGPVIMFATQPDFDDGYEDGYDDEYDDGR